jgi:hypothetical protein
MARKAGFQWIGSLTSRFAEEGKNTEEYYSSALRMAIAVLYKDGGTGTDEWDIVSMQPNEKEDLIRKIFVDNPKGVRESRLTPIYTPSETENKKE